MDGSTAAVIGKTYPTLDYDLVTVAGQNNTVGLPIYLPALSNNSLCVTQATRGRHADDAGSARLLADVWAGAR